MEIEERSVTVGILGADHEITQRIGEALGSPGQRTDLQFYNRLDEQLGIVFTGVVPISYPEKIKSLVQVCAETQIHLMIINANRGITAEIGEIMVIMDIFAHRFQTKFLCAIGGVTDKNEWNISEIKKKLPSLIQHTHLLDIEILSLKTRADYDLLKQKLNNLAPSKDLIRTLKKLPAKVLLDNIFPVKGVGTVALGLVQQGKITASKMYDLIPVQKKVILRSIQKFDRNFKMAFPGERVGLALKGIKSDKIGRDAIFCDLDSLTTTKSMRINLWVSHFYKSNTTSQKISPNESKDYHIIVDLAISAVHLNKGDEISPGKNGILEITLDNEIPYNPNIGFKGIMLDFGPFENKSRIVGYFKQKS
jgi:selenocysteine-specific elongation factor